MERGSSDQPKQPDLSVLMASYNTGRYIEESIESVLAIDDIDVELLIQDGHSSDDTAAIVERINDPRIKFVSAPDEGQSDAINRALARANGRWIGWLNADDLYDREGVRKLAQHMDDPLDFLYGDYGTIDAQGRHLKRYRSSRPFDHAALLRHGVYINCSAAFYKPELLRSVGGLDPALHYCMDYDLLFRIARRRGVRSRYVPATVQYLRSHDDAKTSKYVWRFFKEASKVAYRNADGVPRGHLRASTGLGIFAVYILTQPVWRSAAWRRIRPEKRL